MVKNNSLVDQQLYEPSEGEEFLGDFFCSERIEFDEQVKIENLRGDYKAYRVADFYLPKYNVYVEFFGMWNTSEEKKKDYREKKAIYALNKIPCIYFYPENLGIIHYSFNKRIRTILKEFDMQKELFRFNLHLFFDNKIYSVIGFVFFLGLLILFQFDREAELFWQSCAVVGGLSLYNAYGIYTGYKEFFREEYSYVNFMRE